MKRFGFTLTILVASFGLSACTDPEPVEDGLPDGESTTGGEDNTFDHENEGLDPWKLIERLDKEGPPSFRSQMRGCLKMRVATLRNVMISVGIDVNAAGDPSAGRLFREGANALGSANFANRIREAASITTATASRQLDIFAEGSQEIINAVPNLERCKINNVGAQVFDPVTNEARADGITCIIGVPATDTHLALANLAVRSATDVAKGKRIAVAALMAAATICE